MNYKISGIKRKISLITVVGLMGIMMSGCLNDSKENTTIIDNSAANNSNSNSNSVINNITSAINSEDMFTDRDKEATYDESEAFVIELDGDKISTTASGASVAGNTITLKNEGTYIIRGKLDEGQIIVDAQDTDKLQLVLNNAEITCSNSAPVYIKQADKVFITLADGSVNKLCSKGEFVNIDDNNIDAVIFSKDDLTLNGFGKLTIECESGHGIVSKNDLVVTGGEYDITATSHALSGKDSIRIADGNFKLACGKDGLHADNAEDSTQGFIYIENGSFEIESDDDGVSASSAILIQGGTINIGKCYEGIEAMYIDINGGNISIVSSDDAINVADGSSSNMKGNSDIYLNITGGTIDVNAEGDGIDSNGSIYISGGNIYVSGPTNSGNAALDYGTGAAITGGTFIAAGPSGMGMNFGEASTQGSIMLSIPQMVTGEIKLMSEEGDVLASYTPDKAYNAVVISTPDIEVSKTYVVSLAGEETTVEMDSIIYGNGMGAGNRGGGSNGGGKFNGTIPEDGQHGYTPQDGNIPERGGEKGRPDGIEKPRDMEFPDDMEKPDDMELPEDFGNSGEDI